MKVRLAAALICLCGQSLAGPAPAGQAPSEPAMVLAGLTLMAGIALRRLGRLPDRFA